MPAKETAKPADSGPAKETPAEARPVSAAALVTDNQRSGAEASASDAKPVQVASLVDESSSATPASSFAADFFSPPPQTGASTACAVPPVSSGPEPGTRWPSSISGDGDCQCDKCRRTGKNNDKRGRHHAKCPCPACVKYRGQEAGATAPAATSEPSFSDLPGMDGGAGNQAVLPDVNYEVMARMYFDMTTGGLTMIFGQEWQPENQAERENVCAALKAYLAAKGVQDVSPGWLLTFVVIAYSAPRLKKPTTAGKLKQFGGWCKEKFVRPVFRFFKRRKFYSTPQLLEHEDKTNKESKTIDERKS